MDYRDIIRNGTTLATFKLPDSMQSIRMVLDPTLSSSNRVVLIRKHVPGIHGSTVFLLGSGPETLDAKSDPLNYVSEALPGTVLSYYEEYPNHIAVCTQSTVTWYDRA